jgi:Rieske 2Fe-2S family protein
MTATSEADLANTVKRLRDRGVAADWPATPLTREQYISPEAFEQDIERVFRLRWLFAGHASQISTPGAFFTFRLVNDEVVVCRQRDGRVAAFHNVCRHRGSRFCQERSGVVNAFRCPYHGWTYGLDGSLRLAPKMPDDFDRSEFPAKPVWVEEWNGLIFVAFSPQRPPSVAAAFADTDFVAYDLRRAKTVDDRIYDVASNWKIVAEAFQECYHCTINHPELCRVWDPERDYLEVFDEADAKDETPGVDESDYLIYSDDAGPVMVEGAVTFTVDGAFASQRLLGAPDNPPTKMKALAWFPQFGMFVNPDYAVFSSWLPITPTTTQYRSIWVVHEDAVEGQDYDSQRVIELIDVTNKQDKELCRIAQEGTLSTAYDNTAPYNPVYEWPVRPFLKTYLRYLNGGPGSSGAS